MIYFVYMLKCSDDSYYIGSTSDIPSRFLSHEIGSNKRSYTFSRRPVKLVWAAEFETKSEAVIVERQLKGWSRAKKEALIRDDWDAIHEIVRMERKRREQ